MKKTLSVLYLIIAVALVFGGCPRASKGVETLKQYPIDSLEGIGPGAAPEAAPEVETAPEAEAAPEAVFPETPEEGEEPVEEFSVPSGLFEPEGGEEAEAAPAEETAFELPEEFAFPVEEEAAEPAQAEITAEELPDMPGFDIEGFTETPETEAVVEEGVAQAEAETGERAFTEEAFEFPDEFPLPEEGLEPGPETPAAPQAVPEPAPEIELPAESSEEEADFLKVLQEQLLPDEQAEPAQAPAEETQAEQEAFAEFAEIPLEEPVPEMEEPAEGPSEELSLEEEPEMGAEPEEPMPAEASLEAEAVPEGEHIDLEAPAESIEGAEEFELDEFSLEGLGEPFGMEEEQAPPAVEQEIPAEVPEVAEEFPEEIALPEAGELSFTDEQFAVRLARRLFDADMPAEAIRHYLTLCRLCGTPEEAGETVLAPIAAFVGAHARRGTPRNRDTLLRMQEAIDGLRRLQR